MDGSNNFLESIKMAFRKASENIEHFISNQSMMLVVHDDEHFLNIIKNKASDNRDFNRKIRIFDNVDACFDFIITKVSDNDQLELIVFVGGQLVCDLVSYIHACEQVRVIFIMNKPPFTEEERETMKLYPKVKYFADLQSQVIKEDTGISSSNNEARQRTPLNEPIVFDCIDEIQFNENVDECVEPRERSCKRFDKNCWFRYSMLLCLLHASPYPSSRDNLIELFEKENLASPIKIEKFKSIYSPENAILFYSRDEFIYGKLNSALRIANFRHLFSFRFILQDVCNQLRELMSQQSDESVLTVYRGQGCSPYEIADLTCAYQEGSPIAINSFFSTSKSRDYSVGFLHSLDVKLYETERLPTLFKIIVRKQDASHFLPLADISKISQHPEEEEVLFAPGQIFKITKFDTIFEKGLNIYFFEMTMKSDFNEDLTRVYTMLQQMWNTGTNDPFLHMGMLLYGEQRFDEAKEFYMQLLSENPDNNKKYVCYDQLRSIAMFQNNRNEAMIMLQKMVETKFDNTTLSTNMNDLAISEADDVIVSENLRQTMNKTAEMLFDRPLHEILDYVNNGKFHADFEQFNDAVYNSALVAMKNGMYELAILQIENALRVSKPNGLIPLKPSLKVKFHIQLGHCYGERKFNDAALKYYDFALEQNIHLSPDESIEVIINIGKVLERMNRYEEALHKYIQVAEIYQNDLNERSPEERHEIEESIKRVTSQLISVD